MRAFFQNFSTFDRWLFGVCCSVVSSSHKWMYWTQTGEAICNIHFHKKPVPGTETSSEAEPSFVLYTNHSVVWVQFASNITTAKSKKNENYFVYVWVCHLLTYFWILQSKSLRRAFPHFLFHSQLFTPTHWFLYAVNHREIYPILSLLFKHLQCAEGFIKIFKPKKWKPHGLGPVKTFRLFCCIEAPGAMRNIMAEWIFI